MEFYLDESGNTGGASRQSFESSFSGQRIFTLAAIGVMDEGKISKVITPLLNHYKINSRELKASALFKKKPEFIVDVFSLIRSNGWPIFIEAVDKRFMLAANIVNSLVLPGYCFESETRETTYIRSVFAEYLFFHLPDALYSKFLAMCSTPTSDALIQLVDEFILALKTGRNDVSDALVHSLTMTRDDIEEHIADGKDDIGAYLPVPDEGKRGNTVWMLPNLSSFTNIYARINLFMKGYLSGVKIYHDEQLQFDEILEKAKRDVENLSNDRIGFVSDSVDYKFVKTADLFFKASHSSLGIQIADLLAGFVMRYIDKVLDGKKVDSTISKAHKLLMTMNKEDLGLGLNMMMSARDAHLINRSGL